MDVVLANPPCVGSAFTRVYAHMEALCKVVDDLRLLAALAKALLLVEADRGKHGIS